MCGIFGIVYQKDTVVPDKSRLEETAQLLQHRGPDHFGIYTDSGVGFVHTRLSLLDLSSRSHQPFWDNHGRYCLIYNGEIYNFKELRRKLEVRGVQFRTSSDTEVLMQCLINNGAEATLKKLEGMFAFGFYDKVEKRLVLGRDRFGIKPLFVSDEDDALIFSSEVEAMRPWIKFQPDVLSISSFLYGFGGPTKGHTFHKKIKILSPGSLLNARVGQSSQYRLFFSMSEFWDQEQAEQLQRLKPQKIVDKVEELLLESVRKQLVADAPVGALCSGGVDSSLIMAMATRFHHNLAIFHANVLGPHSEYDAALQLAKHLHLDLKTVEVRDQDFLERMPDVTAHYGHPFYECPHAIPFFMVSSLVKEHHVKAVLSGEGADECYLGYNWLAPNIQNWQLYLKAVVRKLVTRFGRSADLNRRKKVGIQELVMGLHNRFEVTIDAEEIEDNVKYPKEIGDGKGTVQSLKLLHYNLRSLLHRNDSMGMAASIEARFPFLDSELVKLSVNLPYQYKIRFSPTSQDKSHYFFIDKWVMREVAKRFLPRSLSHRSKRPFPVDALKRFRIAPGFFEKSYVVDLFGLSSRETQYLVNNINHSLMTKLLQLDVWAHVSLYNLPKQQILNKLRKHVEITPV